ncbi:MAG TPA: hypothetical protein DCF78_04295 [Dehalococcoidia bacterium]|nr:hypothetical protein [Dehalococcoidia bacterium]
MSKRWPWFRWDRPCSLRFPGLATGSETRRASRPRSCDRNRISGRRNHHAYRCGCPRLLTSASSIWLVAGVGMAVGTGMYIVSVIGAILALFVIHFFPLRRNGAGDTSNDE